MAIIAAALLLNEALGPIQIAGVSLVLTRSRARCLAAIAPGSRVKPTGPIPPLPLTVVTGFLGAGKTTLINRLLRDPALADTVVIVNEFGEIGLDHLLMETVEEGMVLMQSGCLCCTIRGDLVNTLEGLLRRRDNGRIAPFRRCLIETTGLADPAPVLQTLMGHPYLGLRYRLEGVVTLVDAVNGAATLRLAARGAEAGGRRGPAAVVETRSRR